MIAESNRKTDKVDAKILAELLRMDGLPRRVHVAEGERPELWDLLRSRYQFIISATSLMNHFRGMLRQEGIKLSARVFRNRDIFSHLRENADVPDHLTAMAACYERSIQLLLLGSERSEQW